MDNLYSLKNTNGVSWGAVHTVVSADIAQVEAVAEVIKLTIATGCSANGNITVSLRGATPVTIAVTTTADLATEVATLVQAGSFTGWTPTVNSAEVTFTATVAGLKTGANALVVNSTGVTGTFTVVTAGSNEVVNTMKFVTTLSNIDLAVSCQIYTSTGALRSFTGTVVVSKDSNGLEVITVKDNSTASLSVGDVVHLIVNKVHLY